MDPPLLQAKISAATDAIRDAEADLQKVIGTITVATRAEKTGISETVKAAAVTLSKARATLDALQSTVARAKLETARTAIGDAEKYLDQVLSEIVVVPGADTSWVSKVVKDAFTKLRLAKATLADLELAAIE